MDFPDSTYLWTDGINGAGKPIKPRLLVMTATDSNWILKDKAFISNYLQPARKVDNKAMLNCAPPGMRLPGALRWNVNESLDSLTSTATLEMLNALPVSQIETTLTSSLAAQRHSTVVLKHFYKSLKDGVTRNLTQAQFATLPPYASSGIAAFRYQAALALPPFEDFREANVLFREFEPEAFSVGSAEGFPDPRVPESEKAEQTDYWPASTTGVGSYFILIDNEVVRVSNLSGTTFSIPPGGRGVNGVIEAHAPGAKVTLLGFGPHTGEWTAFGYLTQNEVSPQTSIMRPGTCLVSYEGFGSFYGEGKVLNKGAWAEQSGRPKDYDFTGYWFVKGQESTLGADGIPKCSFELASAGHILEEQKITEDTIRKLDADGTIKGGTEANPAYDNAGETRVIPGDWVDYKSWQPSLPNSVPLQIKTEYAQHKEFFDHMASTTYGKTCEFCMQEWLAYIYKKGHEMGADPIPEARAVGKHIYQQSIRVYDTRNDFDPGPLYTYGRLMVELAKLTWEMPLVGGSTAATSDSSATRWTKLPAALWANMRQFQGTGLVWNSTLLIGELDQTKTKGDNVVLVRPDIPRLNSSLDPSAAGIITQPLMCPFESTYDKVAWAQPIKDLADTNRMTFTFARRGFPIFAPKNVNLRGVASAPAYSARAYSAPAKTDATNSPRPGGSDGVWYLSWGKSISSYNYNFKPEGALTKVYTTAKDPFDSSFTLPAAGTGIDIDGQPVWYQGAVGNLEALQLTGGVQQIDTMSLDNLVLGFNWATDPAGWSLTLIRNGQDVEISALPPYPKLHIKPHKLGRKVDHQSASDVKAVQRLYNFLRVRSYMDPAFYKGASKATPVNEYLQSINEDGKFGTQTEAAVKEMQRWMKELTVGAKGDGKQITAKYSQSLIKVDGVWSKPETAVIKNWAENNAEYIKKDVWWYALGGYGWEYYVAAITGLKIPQRQDPTATKNQKKDGSLWVTDQVALRLKVQDWQQTYFPQVLNFGGAMVEDSINKASVRSISVSVADPRICVGDVIYADIPGHIPQRNENGELIKMNESSTGTGTYITQVSRDLDVAAGTYTGSYSGYRYKASQKLVNLCKDPKHYWNYSK